MKRSTITFLWVIIVIVFVALSAFLFSIGHWFAGLIALLMISQIEIVKDN